ncbi:lysophospholipase [Sarracenia purpurea var. burkii]
MSFNNSSGGFGSGISRRFEFGRTHVVRPKGKHQATIVWLHGLGDNGSRLSGSVQLLLLDQWLYLADFPAQLINEYKVLTRFPTGFDVGDIAEEAPDDLDGLDASAAHIANLLSTEPADSRFSLDSFLRIYAHN